MFVAFVAKTLGQLAPNLLRYLLHCAGHAVQRALVAPGDTSIPVDEDDAEPWEARNPTFPRLLALIFQQLKNSILVEVLEAVVGGVLGRYMGVRSDPRLRRFLEENRAPCVPALPWWCREMCDGAASRPLGIVGPVPVGAVAVAGAVGLVSVVAAGSGVSGPVGVMAGEVASLKAVWCGRWWCDPPGLGSPGVTAGVSGCLVWPLEVLPLCFR